jgi:hypothetical protein
MLSLYFLSELFLDKVFCRADWWQYHEGCRLPHHLPPTRGRLSHGSWGKRLQMMRAPLPPPRGVAEGVATSPPVNDTRAGSPLRTTEGVGTSAGEVGATTSPTILDVDPIRTVPGGTEDMVGDQPQIDLAPC